MVSTCPELWRTNGQPMSHWAPIAKRMYERRSDVAHGNLESLRDAEHESSRTSLEFTRNVILQFLLFCHHLQPLGRRRVGTKKEFQELYRECEGTSHDEIDAIIKKYRFKDWQIVLKPTP